MPATRDEDLVHNLSRPTWTWTRMYQLQGPGRSSDVGQCARWTTFRAALSSSPDAE